LQRERERERERERDGQAYIIFRFTRTRTLARALNSAKTSHLKNIFPSLFLSEKAAKRDFFYSKKQIQTTVTGVDFHRRRDGVAPLREVQTLCNPPFLLKESTGAAI
jgi:hypothetical protein